MSVDAFAEGVHEHRTVATVHDVGRATYGFRRVEGVGAVAVDDRQTAKPTKILGDDRISGLFADWHRYAIAVVLHDEDDRQSLAARAVECLEYVAFRTGRLALTAESNRVGVVVLDRAPQPCGVLRVIACCR